MSRCVIVDRSHECHDCGDFKYVPAPHCLNCGFEPIEYMPGYIAIHGSESECAVCEWPFPKSWLLAGRMPASCEACQEVPDAE